MQCYPRPDAYLQSAEADKGGSGVKISTVAVNAGADPWI